MPSPTAGRAPGRIASRTPSGAVSPTSLKLPLALKTQIDNLAGRRGISPHAFMLETLAAAAERARLREQFVLDAQKALHQMIETGEGYDFDDVRDYFAKRTAWRKGAGPKPRRPAPVRTG